MSWTSFSQRPDDGGTPSVRSGPGSHSCLPWKAQSVRLAVQPLPPQDRKTAALCEAAVFAMKRKWVTPLPPASLTTLLKHQEFVKFRGSSTDSLSLKPHFQRPRAGLPQSLPQPSPLNRAGAPHFPVHSDRFGRRPQISACRSG